MCKLLKKITNKRLCNGDRYHNENIELLFNNVDKSSKYAKEIIKTLNSALENCSAEWICDKISMDACRKLSSAMKSKTEKTYVKRINHYLYGTLLSSACNIMFEKDLIKEFTNLCNKYN